MRCLRNTVLLVAVVVAGLLGYAYLSLHGPPALGSIGLGTVLSFQRQPLPVLRCATNGRWVQGPVTQEQRNAKYDLFRFALEWQQVPNSLQREDGLCGNVTYVQRGPNMWIRALCNPTGPTPCCYNSSRCEARSREDCRCPNCRDLRNDIIAEHSRWELLEPADCRLLNWSREEGCRLLQGSTLVLVGDSLMRHVHTALLLLLTGNPWDGALNPGIAKEIHDNCTREKMFTEKTCRLHLKRSARLCDGRVKLEYYGYYMSITNKEFHNLVRTLLGRKDVNLVVGIGFHDRCNADPVFNNYMKPSLEMIRTAGRGLPRITWVSPHAPGLFKLPTAAALRQDEAGIFRFTAAMRERLRPYGVPVLDALNLTRGVASFDGTHTGLAVNLLKAQILLTHIMEETTRKTP